jgi:hypothetical protein
MTRAYGTVNINLPVDLVIADVAAVVVDDDIQLIPIFIGQTLLKKKKTYKCDHGDT